jgi:hypothetical protein
MVSSIRVKRPQSITQEVLFPIVAFTAIVLRLTGVITWPWWWVLSPIWIGAAALVLLITGLVMLFIVFRYLGAWRQRRSPADIWLSPPNGRESQYASGGDLGLQDGHS